MVFVESVEGEVVKAKAIRAVKMEGKKPEGDVYELIVPS